MKNRKFPILLALLALGFLTGCDHDTDTFDGPSLIDRFGEFELLEGLAADRATVDFAAGERVVFTAVFNKRVNWELIITGKSTGAVKRIEGFENELNAQNASWAGGATQPPLFGLESCTVELVVPEAGLSQTIEVETLSRRSYDNVTLIADFNEDAGSNIAVRNFEFEFTNRTGRQNDIPAGEGDFYLLLEGTDNVVPNFFVGLVEIKAGITGETYFPVPTTIPEELFFNSFIYSPGTPYGIAIVEFAYDANDSGAFEDGQDAIFSTGDIPLSWTGWQLYNKPMEELGITEEQLSKIVAIRVILISQMNLQPNPPIQVGFGIDFMNFTAGGPFNL